MAENSLPAGKTCGHCVQLIRCLALGKTEDESVTTCSFQPSRFAEKLQPAVPPGQAVAESTAGASATATGTSQAAPEAAPLGPQLLNDPANGIVGGLPVLLGNAGAMRSIEQQLDAEVTTIAAREGISRDEAAMRMMAPPRPPPVDERIAAVGESLRADEARRIVLSAHPSERGVQKEPPAVVLDLLEQAASQMKPPKPPNNAQVRRERKAAEKAAKRRAIEEQYGIELPKPSKPVVGGRYALVRQTSPIRYGPKVRRG